MTRPGLLQMTIDKTFITQDTTLCAAMHCSIGTPIDRIAFGHCLQQRHCLLSGKQLTRQTENKSNRKQKGAMALLGKCATVRANGIATVK